MRILLAAAAAVTFAIPAMAQEAGTTIVGNDGAEIGTVTANDGVTVMVDTGMHQVPLGPEAFAETNGVWTLNTTKTDLDTAYSALLAEQAAALEAAIVVGAEIITADAMPLGTIEQVNESAVVLTHADQPLTLPKDLLALDPEGKLMVLANMDAIMAAMNAAS